MSSFPLPGEARVQSEQTINLCHTVVRVYSFTHDCANVARFCGFISVCLIGLFFLICALLQRFHSERLHRSGAER